MGDREHRRTLKTVQEDKEMKERTFENSEGGGQERTGDVGKQ